MTYNINIDGYGSFMQLLFENVKNNLTPDVNQEYLELKTTEVINNFFIARKVLINKIEYEEIAVRSFTIENFNIPNKIRDFLNTQLSLTHQLYLEMK